MLISPKNVYKNFEPNALEARLRPKLGLATQLEECEAHDNYSGFSHYGFIGQEEDFWSLIRRDNATLIKLGVTYREIADALRELITLNDEDLRRYHLGSEVVSQMKQGYQFHFLKQTHNGPQSCPWECPLLDKERNEITRGFLSGVIVPRGVYAKNANVLSKGYNHVPRIELPFEFAYVSTMSPHLIEKHYLFQGEKQPFRIDPELVIKACGLA
ncbi:hypothetical protein HOD05_02660 [Candidatus Woesearchaeota archaeon]|nr:hypothetical protein [Candidatus Woesearchaeota archaeon]MBT4434098.1 hypothetical protein [Candidatus Woesearchaeota archaeon]MBT7332412.1 hypothetical protein [Candidatus Woesearchaeota archaeon]